MRFSVIVLLVLFAGSLCAQTKSSTVSADKVKRVTQKVIAGKDSSALKDSSAIKDSLANEGGLDSTVYAAASDSLIFYVQTKKMELYGTGSIKYKTTDLKSGEIFVDFNTNILNAKGQIKDTAGKKTDNSPVLTDNGNEYKGSRMVYNFKTTKGFITYASTKESEAAYSGAKIKKVDEETFFVENGVYTTCDDKEHPHYYFFGSEMKFIQKDQLIGKWIWLMFGDVPFPIPIPFAVIPVQSGRRSGIIAPAFGMNGTYGKYFSHFGYFWAISDLMDLNLTGDYYTNGGFGVNSRYRYAKRYEYTGNIEGGWSRLYQGDPKDKNRATSEQWRIGIVHNQTISPTSRFDINAEFQSGKYYQDKSLDLNKLLRNEIYSNATYFKSWEEAGASLSASYSRKQDLQTGNTNEVLPSVSFSKSQIYPFRGKNSFTDEHWYDLFSMGYNGLLENRRDKTDGNLKIRGGVQHSVSFSFSPKVGYFSIVPSFGYRELWYNKQIEKRNYITTTGRDSIVDIDVNKFAAVRTYNFGVGTSTKLYGMFQPDRFGIAAFRHTIIPSVSYNFTPDFSRAGWGYYGTYTDSLGQQVKYNRFEKEIFGGAGNRESQSISFRLDNVFELKTKPDPRDTTSKEQKIQLLNIGLDYGYDFTADSLNSSDIRLSYRTQVGQWLNLSGNSSYTMYNDVKERFVRQTLYSAGRGFLRMTSFGFSASVNLNGDKKTEPGKEQGEEVTEEVVFPQENRSYRGLYDIDKVDFSIPWNVNFSYTYSLESRFTNKRSEYSSINASLGLSISKNWKISATGSYDFRSKQFAAPQITINRDLHCWMMNFTWNPIGQFTGFRFEIRVKASQLQDLKVTKDGQFFNGRI